MLVLDRKMLWYSISVDFVLLLVATFWTHNPITGLIFGTAISVKVGISMSFKDVKIGTIEVDAVSIKVINNKANQKEMDKVKDAGTKED